MSATFGLFSPLVLFQRLEMERDDESTIEGESSIRSDSENEFDPGTAADLTIPLSELLIQQPPWLQL